MWQMKSNIHLKAIQPTAHEGTLSHQRTRWQLLPLKVTTSAPISPQMSRSPLSKWQIQSYRCQATNAHATLANAFTVSHGSQPKTNGWKNFSSNWSLVFQGNLFSWGLRNKWQHGSPKFTCGFISVIFSRQLSARASWKQPCFVAQQSQQKNRKTTQILVSFLSLLSTKNHLKCHLQWLCEMNLRRHQSMHRWCK